ncbi:hypothetical protein HYT24_01520 [Candidatus Pacearchaeota archaeon]|nr:hypothetical protein [Candidatus Pacearchaeota archaeon]
MNLSKKKELAARTFNVGKGRIVFIPSRINEIKEAITKQDMRDLMNEGAITIKNIKGSRKKVRRKSRSAGNIRKKVRNTKREYMILTRKLRGYIKEMKNTGKVSREVYLDVRKKIRNRFFKSKANLKEYLAGLEK